MLRRLVIFTTLGILKAFGHVFYKTQVEWVGPRPQEAFRNVRLALLMNHTSLFEPIFSTALSWGLLWEMSGHAVVPVAVETLNRPIVGGLIKSLCPKVIPITRKRDDTWKAFMNDLSPEDVIFMAPEGRMKRETGLDKNGNPMTIRGGICDILEIVDEGDVLFGYSGGLHHVQSPGSGFPKLFKSIAINFEQITVAELKRDLGFIAKNRRSKIDSIRRLEERRDRNCPSQE